MSILKYKRKLIVGIEGILLKFTLKYYFSSFNGDRNDIRITSQIQVLLVENNVVLNCLFDLSYVHENKIYYNLSN